MNSISPFHPQLNNEIPAKLQTFAIADAGIILIVLLLSAFTLPAIRMVQPDNVLIFKDNAIIATYPLTIDRIYTLQGAVGPVQIAIKNKSVSILQSRCPHRICKQTGSIRSANAQIICAPNHLLITIASKSATKQQVDGCAR